MTVLASEDTTAEALVVIVTYNSSTTIDALLDSVEASSARVRVVVVDNGSKDATVERARSHARVIVDATGANLGYSGGVNVGRRHRRPHEAVVVLNPDLALEAGTLPRLLGRLTDRGVGIVAPLLRELPGRERFDSLRREPSVLRAVGDSVFGGRWRSRPAWFAETLRRDEDYARVRDVAWAGGAALAVSAECDEAVGAWDSATYFLYSEETDYARRARDLGFRVRFEPSAVAFHEGSGSGQPPALVALISVNRIRYFERLHGRIRSSAFRGAVALQHLLRLHDVRHRYALPVVLRRSRWDSLPTGDPTPAIFATSSVTDGAS